MRFNEAFNPFDPKNFSSWQQWASRITTDLGRVVVAISRIFEGQITFGNGIDIDNIKGEWITFTSHASGGTETAVTHTLGEIPVGFLTVIPPASGTVNKGTTAWTSTTIYITCSANSQSVTIFVLAPPVTV